MSERTDPLAAIRAAQYARQAAQDAVQRGPIWADGTVSTWVAQESVPDAIVASFAAQEEHRDGQRRVVLYGAWEVDPAATARYVPKADAA